MPSSRDMPPKFSKGQRLTANDLNQMSDIVRALAGVGDAQDVIAIGGGTFRRQKRVTPQIRDAVLTSDMDAAGSGAPEDDKATFTFNFLYPHKSDPDLLDAGTDEITGVNRNAGLSGSTGDYIAVCKMGVEWRPLGGGGCKTKLVKTLSSQTAGGIVECAQYTGAYSAETTNAVLVVCYVRGVDVDSDIWGWATPKCAVEGQEAGGGTSEVAVDTEHPSGFIGPADHEFTPLECNT